MSEIEVSLKKYYILHINVIVAIIRLVTNIKRELNKKGIRRYDFLTVSLRKYLELKKHDFVEGETGDSERGVRRRR